MVASVSGCQSLTLEEGKRILSSLTTVSIRSVINSYMIPNNNRKEQKYGEYKYEYNQGYFNILKRGGGGMTDAFLLYPDFII